MSNLGGYQLLTTAAKKVGGPGNLVVLIEKMGDTNNPYFISGDFLKEISDYTSG